MLAQRRDAARRVACALALLLALAAGAAPGQAAPARQTPPAFGRVEALAVDAAGNGWAWAAPAPQTFGTNFLLRLQAGVAQRHDPARIISTLDDSALLPPRLQVRRLAITDAGDAGWGVGNVAGAAGGSRPLVWRLQGGAWRVFPAPALAGLELLDLTLAASGGDGWLTARDPHLATYRLFRLRNGAWQPAASPAGAQLQRVALSPDGQSGWAASGPTTGAGAQAYRLSGGVWALVPGALTPPGDQVAQLAADDAGQGWLITQPADPQAGGGRLVRLRTTGPPVPVALPPAAPGQPRRLQSLSVDALGRGWATAIADVGEALPGDPLSGRNYAPLFLRLAGDSATRVDNQDIGLAGAISLGAQTIATNADGTHTWLGWFDRSGSGLVDQLTDVWPHWGGRADNMPGATAPLPGPGRCFAAVPYCLRGVFAQYWAQHGGLAQLGYPITPEVAFYVGKEFYAVQWTERARLEWHPEQRPPYDVLLGLLGNALADPRTADGPFQRRPALAGARWFTETQHNLAAPFLAYWQGHGGLAIFGLPRSEAFDEPNAADGQVYRVQYFERARVEYHPEHAGTPFAFQLGLLGVEQFAATYGYAP